MAPAMTSGTSAIPMPTTSEAHASAARQEPDHRGDRVAGVEVAEAGDEEQQDEGDPT